MEEDRDEIADAMEEMLREILEVYEERVPEHGVFKDLRAWRQVHYGDPQISLPGKLEIIVMHMDREINTQFDNLRFVSVRVTKSRSGGFAASTCLHGTKREVRERLQQLLEDPDFLVERALELAHGLPEETNPDVWR